MSDASTKFTEIPQVSLMSRVLETLQRHMVKLRQERSVGPKLEEPSNFHHSSVYVRSDMRGIIWFDYKNSILCTSCPLICFEENYKEAYK